VQGQQLIAFYWWVNALKPFQQPSGA